MLYPAEGSAGRRQDVCASRADCWRGRNRWIIYVFSAVEGEGSSQTKPLQGPDSEMGTSDRVGWDEGVRGVGGSVLCCITQLNINKSSWVVQWRPTQLLLSFPLLATPALIGSWFGRVTFLLCGQLHPRHAHLLAQDDGGVRVAAQWRLVLTWGTEDRTKSWNAVYRLRVTVFYSQSLQNLSPLECVRWHLKSKTLLEKQVHCLWR